MGALPITGYLPPVMDGITLFRNRLTITEVELTDVPLSLIKRGNFHRVPVIFGATLNDGLYYISNPPLSAGKCRECHDLQANYTQQIQDSFGANASQILSLYPPATDSRVIYDQILADTYFRFFMKSR